MKQHITFLLLLTCGFSLTGCVKYAPSKPLPNAAYIRVFNSIPDGLSFAGGTPFVPFMTFIMDPRTDASGAIDTGAVVGDYLTTRYLFSPSVPADAGTDPDAPEIIYGGASGNSGLPVYNGKVNYEYPGKIRVPAAPVMNGIEMSSWAQVPSGKHRVVFVLRPRNNSDFSQLDKQTRQNILIDTTISLDAGEVYTIESLCTDLDKNTYGLYMRHEDFYKKVFDPTMVYAGFANLSGKYPAAAQSGYSNNFGDSVSIYYTYIMKDYVASGSRDGGNPISAVYQQLFNINNLFCTTTNGRMPVEIDNFTAIPMPPRSDFFYADSTLKTYATNLQNLANDFGDLPFVWFNFYNGSGNGSTVNPMNSQFNQKMQASNAAGLMCAADPVTFKTFSPDISTTRRFQPNLNMIITSGQKTSIYPTINIFELVNDRVFLMQMQYAFNTVPQ